jgi:peroxiredoxin Q/BCP
VEKTFAVNKPSMVQTERFLRQGCKPEKNRHTPLYATFGGLMSIELNTQIPEFAPLQATSDTEIVPSSLKGQFSVLYFYPKDSTPGCTTESQDFSSLHGDFAALNCQIFGVSRDSLKSHENFKAKYDMPFELISDPDEDLCNAFDVMKMKNMYGKQVRGVERSTFLIDPNGTLIAEWRKVKVPGHAEEVLQTLKDLS